MALQIDTQPQSQTVPIGANVDFSVVANDIRNRYGANATPFNNGDWTIVNGSGTITADYIQSVAPAGVGDILNDSIIAGGTTITSVFIVESYGVNGYIRLPITNSVNGDSSIYIWDTVGGAFNFDAKLNGVSDITAVTLSELGVDDIITITATISSDSTSLSVKITVDYDGGGSETQIINTSWGTPATSMFASIGAYENGVNRITSCEIIDAATITYQWKKDTVDIPTETNDTLSLTNVQSGDFDDYTVEVADGIDTILSDIAVLSEAIGGRRRIFLIS